MRREKRRGRAMRQPSRGHKVEDLSEVRVRRKKQKIRKLMFWAILLAVLLVWLIARNSTMLISAGDLVETLRIGTIRGPGFPQDTGIGELYQWQNMTGGFVALGQENCVFYTDQGVRMRSIQAGYARPAISAGDTRFVLYNRGGTELRVESRSKNLYTQSYTGGILLCEMGADGSLAVVTEDPSYTAQMLVYPSSMEKPLTWKLTSNEGMPMCLAFAPNEKKLATVTLSAVDGKTVSRVYLLDRSKQEKVLVDTHENGIPLSAQWLGDTLLVAYNNGIVAYQEKKGAVAQFDLNGRTLTDFSMLPNGRMALLLNNGAASEIILLDKNMKETAMWPVEVGRGITLTKTGIYLYTDANVICYTLEGNYAWHISCNLRPQGLLSTKTGVLLFQGGTVQQCVDPELGK